MPRRVDERLLLARICAPQNEDHERFVVHRANDFVGERLPASSLVRRRLAGAHGERGVEQQHSAAGPRLQVAVPWWLHTEIVAQLFEDVGERRRHRDAVLHREAQAVRLPGPVVRILPENQHLHVGIRSTVQRGKDLIVRRIHGVLLALVAHERLQLFPIRLLELAAQERVPIGRHLKAITD